MKFFRFQNADGSANFVNVEQIQWIESTHQGQACVLHMAGGGVVRSGSPSREIVNAIEGQLNPKPAAAAAPVLPPPTPPIDPPVIDFATLKPAKSSRAKAEA